MCKMKKGLVIICLCMGILTLVGCRHSGSYDVESLNIVVFENMTGHALRLDVWEWNHDTGLEDKFCSLDIPAGSSASEGVIRYIFSTGLFSTCKFVFDNGKTLTYHCDLNGARNDPFSPLQPAAYNINRLSDRCVWTFKITDYYYQKAE